MEVPSVGFCYNKYFTALQGFFYLFSLMNSQVAVGKMWEPVCGSVWKRHVTSDCQRHEACLQPHQGHGSCPGPYPPSRASWPTRGSSSRGVAGAWPWPLHAGAEGAGTWPWPCCVPRGARCWARPHRGRWAAGTPQLRSGTWWLPAGLGCRLCWDLSASSGRAGLLFRLRSASSLRMAPVRP